MKDFNGQVVLITGAASGFGKILAQKLSADGAKLVLGDLNQQGLKEVADSLDCELVFQACDVSKEAQVKSLVELAQDTFGNLDIAINNAGISTPMKSLVDTTEAEMDLNFAVNTKGVLFGMKYQIPIMQAQRHGSILNVASMAGIGGAPKLAAYAASKHAVVGITKTAAVEYGRYNIRVNAVCPYFSPTPMTASEGFDSVKEFLAQGSPMKRLGEPEEMVNAMLSIIDPANSYLNGQAIAVDGGVAAL